LGIESSSDELDSAALDLLEGESSVFWLLAVLRCQLDQVDEVLREKTDAKAALVVEFGFTEIRAIPTKQFPVVVEGQ
jgi:hypothetical protein